MIRDTGRPNVLHTKVVDCDGALDVRVKDELNVEGAALADRSAIRWTLGDIVAGLHEPYRLFAYVAQALQRFGWLAGLRRRIREL